MSYTIRYLKEVITDDIPRLSKSAKELIKRAIEERLCVDPVSFGKPLQYGLRGQRRLRVSSYRIIYRIDQDKKEVVIVAIAHRKNVYEQ